MTDRRRGVRIGIDVGRARIGVARSDPDGLIATPVETVARNQAAVTRITSIAAEHEATAIVVGLPVNMRGEDTASTRDARAFAAAVARESGIEVRLIDERLSTVTAHTALREAGRSQRKSRGVVDQVAAVILLQQALDIERATARPAGILISLEAN